MNLPEPLENPMTTWELLPTLPRAEEPIAPSTALGLSDKAAATGGENNESTLIEESHVFLGQLQVITPSDVPSYRMWHVSQNLAFTHSDEKTLFSLNPDVIDKIQELKGAPHRGPAHYMKEHIASIAFGEMGIAAVVGAERGYVLSGGEILFGALGGSLGVIGGNILSYAHEAAIKGRLRVIAGRKADAFSNLVAGAADTYAVPSGSSFGDNLGKAIVEALEVAKDPQEVLHTKLLPLLKTIMDAEVELPIINAEIANIQQRADTLGGVIKHDKQRINQLVPKRDELEASAYTSVAKLLQFRKDQQKINKFMNVLGEIEAVDTSTAPDIREFNQGLSMALQSAYTPDLSKIFTQATKDWIRLTVTLDNTQILQPVYDAFVKKYQQEGLILPDFEALQEQIAKTREQR